MQPYLTYVESLQKKSLLADRKDFMGKFAAVVVTYFPDTASIESLRKISNLCDKLIVIDNTPIDTPSDFPRFKNVTIRKFPENVGLAAALNRGIRLAGQEDYENIFLLDQDSRPPIDFFKEMLIFKSKIDSMITNCALYVPNFYDRNSRTFAKFPLLTRFTLKHATCAEIQSGPCRPATIAITSGTLMTYSGYKEIGPLRDDYFIDFVDNEYCLRAHKLGYRIAVNCNMTLDHAIGTRSVHKFFGVTIKPNFHSSLRRYYIARNGIRTALDYAYYYPSYVFLILARMIHESLSILLFEGNKHRKLRAMIYGIYHGIMGRMGKCQVISFMS
jgi:rhamnosyltransferase